MARSCNHWCSGKAIIITYSECVFVTLGIQHATRVRHIFIYCLSASKIFLHVFSQTVRFSGKKLLNLKCVFRFSLLLLSEIFLISRRIQRARYYHNCTVRRYACKAPVNIVRFGWKLNFLTDFQKILRYQIS